MQENKTKTKICQVTMHYLPISGGQQVYIDNLNKILVENNFDASVLQRKVKQKNNTGTKIFFVTQIPRYFLLHPFIYNAGWFAFNIGLFLSKKILKDQDILICHYPFHYPPLKWHKKVIIISHGVLWSNTKKNVFFDIYHKYISKHLKNKDVFIVANDTNFLREIGYSVEPGKNMFSEVKKMFGLYQIV
ncbi:MAG: hypothetical protein WC087_01375 [Candidatus Paceibacterota bacterium]